MIPVKQAEMEDLFKQLQFQNILLCCSGYEGKHWLSFQGQSALINAGVGSSAVQVLAAA